MIWRKTGSASLLKVQNSLNYGLDTQEEESLLQWFIHSSRAAGL